MSEGPVRPGGGRHAQPSSVDRRRVLQASLIAGAAVTAAGVGADLLLGQGRAAAPKSAPQPHPRPATPTVTRPARPPAALTGKVVVLDPGHNPNNIHHLAQIDRLTPAGGFLKACNTVGTETDGGYPEYDFTLDVARRAKVILRAAGAKVIMTQNGHTPYGPCNDVRARIGNRARADAVIAIHADGGPAEGYGFAALTPLLVDNSAADNGLIIRPSAHLGDAVVRHFAAATGEPISTYLGANGIQPRSDLAGLNLSTVPKVFIECANMRNAQDALKVADPAWREAAAHGIATSIIAFIRQ
jgi:N-acetylmuramoyl-L-alanine amidase